MIPIMRHQAAFPKTRSNPRKRESRAKITITIECDIDLGPRLRGNERC